MGQGNWFGAIAQLVERLNGIEEVSGSNPLSSIFIFSLGFRRLSVEARLMD